MHDALRPRNGGAVAIKSPVLRRVADTALHERATPELFGETLLGFFRNRSSNQYACPKYGHPALWGGFAPE